jgi:predicted kinase
MVKLYILCGIPFSGKTTLANELVKRLSFTRIDLDEVKFDLFGKDITDEEIDQSGWDKIYQEMYKKIEEALQNGKTVIHDTGNFTKYERSLISDIAKKVGVEYKTIFVYTPIPIARQRLLKNRETNERFDVTDKAFDETVAEMEPPGEDENAITYDSSEFLEEFIKKI